MDVVTYIFGFWVEPVSNVRSGGENDRVTERTVVILGEQEGQVKHFVEETDPAVSAGAMKGDFLRCIEASKLVGSWNVSGVLDF